MAKTKQSAQEEALVALGQAEDATDAAWHQANATRALAWATLAQTLPNETEALKARPFREVVQ